MKLITLSLALLWLLGACDDSGGQGSSSTCGDGRLDPGEACDGAAPAEATCVSLGWRQGQLACTATCELDVSDCASWGRCGDGVLQDAAEQCDRLQLGGATCGDLGFHGGDLACAEDCTFDTAGCDDAGFCGDGVRQDAFEACDGAVPGGITCADEGYHEGTPACADDCTLDFSTCSGFCGDGLVTAAFEECDPLVPVTEGCDALGLWTGLPGCAGACVLARGTCAGVEELALGNGSVYVVDSAGGGWGWGWSDGGVGQPYLQHFATPMPIALPGALPFRAVATFDLHACAIDVHRNAWCWGAGAAGQLGNGASTLSYEPVPVRMPNGVYFEAITVGYDHSCGLGQNGRAYCWGANGHGQVGNGSTTAASTASAVVMPEGVTFTRISAGFNFTCAVGSDGQAWCWGRNDYSQLGLGNTTNRTSPAAVSIPGATVIAIDCGSSAACAVTAAGSAHCWGRNDTAQLGLGDLVNRPLPALRTEPAGVVLRQITMGAGHGCATSADDRVWCWGFNNTGQVGDGTTITVGLPVAVPMPGSLAPQAIEAGVASTCARLAPGRLACWGNNGQGQFGFPNVPQLSPVLVPGP